MRLPWVREFGSVRDGHSTMLHLMENSDGTAVLTIEDEEFNSEKDYKFRNADLAAASHGLTVEDFTL